MDLIVSGGMTPQLVNEPNYSGADFEMAASVILKNLLDTSRQPQICADSHWPIGNTNKMDLLNLCTTETGSGQGTAIIFPDRYVSNYFGDNYGNALVRASQVPLPAGIYLFLSGLVGLGLMRGRNA